MHNPKKAMFDFREALLRWNGEQINLTDLRKRLSDLRLEYLGEMPPEIGVRQLLVLALDRRWIIEEETGYLLIQVPGPPSECTIY